MKNSETDEKSTLKIKEMKLNLVVTKSIAIVLNEYYPDYLRLRISDISDTTHIHHKPINKKVIIFKKKKKNFNLHFIIRKSFGQ